MLGVRQLVQGAVATKCFEHGLNDTATNVLTPRRRDILRTLSQSRATDADADTSIFTKEEESVLVDQGYLTNAIKEKFMWHYRHCALAPERRRRSLLLMTSFLDPKCSSDTRVDMFCRSFDEFVTEPEEARGVIGLHEKIHWADGAFSFPPDGMLQVQGVDSMSTTGDNCVALAQLDRCLTDVTFNISWKADAGLLHTINAPVANVQKAMMWTGKVFARALLRLQSRALLCVHLDMDPLVSLVMHYCLENVTSLQPRASKLQPDGVSCGVYGNFRLVEFLHGEDLQADLSDLHSDGTLILFECGRAFSALRPHYPFPKDMADLMQSVHIFGCSRDTTPRLVIDLEGRVVSYVCFCCVQRMSRV